MSLFTLGLILFAFFAGAVALDALTCSRERRARQP
jgi:hypothetical protein